MKAGVEANTRAEGVPVAPRGTITVPAVYLVGLATKARLSGTAFRVLLLILAAPAPISARAVALQLGVSYSFVKAGVRRLRRAGLLDATPTGLEAVFNPPGWEDVSTERAAAAANGASSSPGRPVSRRDA